MNTQFNDYPLDEQELIEKIEQHFLLQTPEDADEFIYEFNNVLRQEGIKILGEEVAPGDSSQWLQQASTAMDKILAKLKAKTPFKMPKKPIEPASLDLRIQLKAGDIAAKLFDKELSIQVDRIILGTRLRPRNKNKTQ